MFVVEDDPSARPDFLARGSYSLLERVFQRQKVAAKPPNDAYFANLY